MTEIAVRALSPGINDPKTAVNCVQSLTSCLSIMMRCQPPSPYHFYTPNQDNDGSESEVKQQRLAILAVVTYTPNIADFISTSLGEIRRYAAADLMVLKALCQAIINLSYAQINNAQQQTLFHELTLIQRAGENNLNYQALVDDLVTMCQQAQQFLLSNDAQHGYFKYVSEFDAISIKHYKRNQNRKLNNYENSTYSQVSIEKNAMRLV